MIEIIIFIYIQYTLNILKKNILYLWNDEINDRI